MSQKISFKSRVRYWFDNVMGRGLASQIFLLFLILLSILGIFSAIQFATSSYFTDEESFLELLLNNYRTLWAADPGDASKDSSPFAIFVLVFMMFVGVIASGILIGIISSAIESKLESLSEGRSFVAEHDHTLILGWGNAVMGVINELIIANENVKRAVIVVLSPLPKSEMDQAIREEVSRAKNVRIVTRSGDPVSFLDLDMVNINAAKSIIILPPDNDDDADIEITKTLLSIRGNPKRRKAPYHIVSSINDNENMEVAYIAGADEAELICKEDFISRLAAQTCLQSGLPVIYREIFGFEGNEIYFEPQPGLVGKTFGEAMSAFGQACPIGIFGTDDKLMLAPDMDRQIEQGEQLICIAEDDDRLILRTETAPKIFTDAIQAREHVPETPSSALLIGWKDRVRLTIIELNEYLTPGSRIVVFAEDDAAKEALATVMDSLENLEIIFKTGSPTRKSDLIDLKAEEFDHIFINGGSREGDRSDAHVLNILLHLRNLLEKAGKQTPIVSEIYSERTRKIAESSSSDDFIVGDYLVGLLYSQIAENRWLNKLFDELLTGEGSEIYLKSARDYVRPGSKLNFHTLVEAGKAHGEVVIGYRLYAERRSRSKSYGIVLNPDRSTVFELNEEDKVIIIARDM